MRTGRLVAPAERLDFQLCGGLRVSRGDEDLDLSKTARQGRLALAFLVLNHGRAVTREELMERVWTDPDPQRVAASLSQTLSRLRQVLGRERIERLPSGAVRLRGPLRVDIAHAEQTLKDSRRAAAERQWTEALAAAQAVLDELAGDVLAGDAAEWLDEVRRAVADLRLEAYELHATCALRMGAWSDALASARSALAASPSSQSVWALLIEAQAAHGDVGLATQTFHELRRRLLDESGLTPSRELIELHRRLVTGELSDASKSRGPVAFPPALAVDGADQPFVGRDAILGWLQERYDRARDGTRQFVVLCGEPGIGKTRLASEFARDAHRGGAIVLYGRSDAETLVPYQPFVTAIGHYVTSCGDAALARELDAELSELGRLIPDIARRVPVLREPLAVDPEMRRFRMFNAVANVLAFVARERPVVLVLDDLQWADASTALLLQHTVQEMHEVRLLILGTLRDVEACRARQLADFLARPQRGVERVPVPGLDTDETLRFVIVRQGHGATHEAVGVLLDATAGNPLLLDETLKSLAEIEPAGGEVSVAAVRRVGVPERAKQVIGRRLARLTETTQRVLANAAVAGAEFDLRIVESASALSAEAIIAALEEASAAGLLREVHGAVDRFSFSHALVREALNEGQSAARRRRLHHKLGEALEALRDSSEVHPAELAHHFSESHDPGDREKALTYALEAGDRAAAALAHEDAAEHYRRALRLLMPGDERLQCEMLLKLGRVELRQGSRSARQTFGRAAELAARNHAPELLGRAALGFASRYTEAGVVDSDGIALLETARNALHEPSALRAEVTARLADSLHFAPEPGEAERLSEEALTIARDVDDRRALAAALESRHAALMSIEHLDERLQLSQELIELARVAGERELEALGRHWRIYDLLEAADVEEAGHQRRALDALAHDLRQPLYQHFSVGWEVVWAHLAGDVDEVEPLARRFRELGIAGQARDTETIYQAQLIALYRRQERLPDFISTVQAAVKADPALLAWRAVLPLVHLASNDPQAAAIEFEWFARENFSRVRRDMFWFTTMSVLAETCALLRDTARAQTLYTLLQPFEHRNVQVTQAACWGSSERFLGLLAATLGRWETAVRHLERAIEKNESSRNPAAAAVVRRDLAGVLRAQDSPEEHESRAGSH